MCDWLLLVYLMSARGRTIWASLLRTGCTDNVGQGVGTGPTGWEDCVIKCEGNTKPAYCTPQALSDKGTHAAQQQMYCPTGHVQSPERNIARRGVPVYRL